MYIGEYKGFRITRDDRHTDRFYAWEEEDAEGIAISTGKFFHSSVFDAVEELHERIDHYRAGPRPARVSEAG